MPRPKKVKKGDTVKIHYTCTLSNGALIDSSFEDEPLEFTVGKGEVIKGFEEAVKGMSVGEKATKKIPAEKAYGTRHEEWVLEVGRDKLPEDWQPEVGLHLDIPREDGQTTVATVTHVSSKMVTLDFNHPLAGNELIFTIKLLEIARKK